MAVYAMYLYFELKTHSAQFNEESKKIEKRGPRRFELQPGAIQKGLARAGGIAAAQGRVALADRALNDKLLRPDAFEAAFVESEPRMHIYICFATLIIGTTILAFNTQFMTDSIQGLTEKAGVPKDFIGMILLPILAHDAMAVQCASKDQMDLAIQSALGKSIQTALVVAPVLVVVGWGMGVDDMNLLFDGFQVSALFVSVLSAQQCILDEKSNWYVILFFS
jgi:Ca2+:H+ antiporter